LIDLTKTVNVDTCVCRDRGRVSRVGRAVIENMALRYNLLPQLVVRRKITIWDIDGTLANIDHRLDRVDKNGKKIHVSALKSEAWKDGLNRTIAEWLLTAHETFQVFVVSGRGTDEAIPTENWLANKGVHPDRVFMRNGGDNRSDDIVKQEILDRIFSTYGRDSIEFVVDDRPRVVAMWRKNGLKVYPVNQGSWEGKE
jgi:hypothetical protein